MNPYRRRKQSRKWTLVLGLVAIALAGLTSIATASPTKTTSGDIDAMRAKLADMRADLKSANERIAELEPRLGDRRVVYEEGIAKLENRVVALYTSGHPSAAAAAFLSALHGDAEDLVNAASIANQLGQHEAEIAQDLADIAAEIAELEAELIETRETRGTLLDKIIKLEDDLHEEIQRVLRMKAEAEKRAREAREKAAEMAAAPQAPLLPSQTTPESVTRLVAEEAEQSAAGAVNTSTEVMESVPAGYTEVGEASYYSEDFAGQNTANGESFNPADMTAAHKHLPFGTLVTVTGPGGSVLVRINDRGPFVGGRIIDLSHAAAIAIGALSPTDVTITVQG